MQDIEEEIIINGKVTGDNKIELQKYFEKEIKPHNYVRGIKENSGFTDKLRLLTIMILCHKDLDELDKLITKTEQDYAHEKEKHSLHKIRIMFNKKKVSLSNRNNLQSL